MLKAESGNGSARLLTMDHRGKAEMLKVESRNGTARLRDYGTTGYRGKAETLKS
jgi:hypothetical protein